jgi:hypothetical protein
MVARTDFGAILHWRSDICTYAVYLKIHILEWWSELTLGPCPEYTIGALKTTRPQFWWAVCQLTFFVSCQLCYFYRNFSLIPIYRESRDQAKSSSQILQILSS